MRSFYLGPSRPRLRADTWGDVVEAAAAGVLDETHWVELKQDVPATGEPANLELAKDLASLSVDGGVLVIGIEDDAGSAGEVVGVDPATLVSRATAVARGRITPPLNVTVHALEKPGEPGLAVVLVTVPASASAPHMVDDRYWGRDGHGKCVLSDEEVRRLLRERQERSLGYEDRLRSVSATLGTDQIERSRVHVLLEPVTPAARPVAEVLEGQNLLALVLDALAFHPTFSLWQHIGSQLPHPDGLCCASGAPEEASDGTDFMAVLLADDGSVLVSGPASRELRAGEGSAEAVGVGQLLETVHGALRVAAAVAARHTGYQGAWRAGVLVTSLKGLLASQAYTDMGFQRYLPYPAQDYLMVADTTSDEMELETSSVVARLMRNVLRGLGVDKRFLPYSDPREFVQRL